MAALTLGAGVGVSAAVFSLVDGIFLRPSPIRDAAHVIVVWPIRRSAPKDQAAYSLADFRGFEKRPMRLRRSPRSTSMARHRSPLGG